MMKKISGKRGTAQLMRAMSMLVKMVRLIRGYLTADLLALKFGGVNQRDERIASEQIFSPSQVVSWTKKYIVDSDLIATPSAARLVTRLLTDRRHEVLPGLEVGTKEWIDYIKTLTSRLSKEVPPSDRYDGICDSRGVPRDWNTLYSAPGCPMYPGGYPICDNRGKGLALEPVSERHDKIMDETIRALFCHSWTPVTGMEIAKKSNSGLPDAEYDVSWKMDKLHDLIRELPNIHEAFVSNDLRRLARDYGIVFAYLIRERNQNDTVVDGSVKPRSAPSLAQSIGAERGILYAGRAVDFSDEFFRTRRRIVYAGNGPLNYLFAAHFSPLRDSYLTRYKFTLKHTSAEDIEKKLMGWLPVGVDASQFDQNYPKFFADKCFDLLAEHTFDSRVVDLMRACWSMPVVVPSPVPDDPSQVAVIGDPFDPATWTAQRGLPSGIAYNPDFGKAWGLAYLMCALDDIFGDVLEVGVDAIWRGEHPSYALLNQGDDAVPLFRDEQNRQTFLERLKTGELSPYIKLDMESPLTFLGWVLTKNGSEYRVMPNVQSMVINFVANEHSIGDPRMEFGHRKHWALGVEAWESVFGVCPEYRKVRTIIEEVTREVMGRSLTAISSPIADLSRNVLGMSGLSPEDARFLEKPERRFYSLDASKVSRRLVDDVIRTVPPDEIMQLISRYVKPKILAE